MGEWLLPAIALMLVLEGLLPLVAPRMWRNVFRQMTELKDGQVRFIGLASVILGGVLLAMVRK
ncbi:MAG TPA: DUF2065 domain-containing protein [Polyangiales bacterium]|jgi:uncharacterized protein YjeT (DUF2065 family)|nr:DUF2065 domain-containing protein [Polyangiales bacterium]